MLQNTYSYTVVSAKKFMVIINVYLERSEEYKKNPNTNNSHPIVPTVVPPKVNATSYTSVSGAWCRYRETQCSLPSY